MQTKIIPHRIRCFDTPQVFIALAPLECTAKYFWRHIRQKCPIIADMAEHNRDELLEECRLPQTIKIQAALYVTGNKSPINYAKLLGFTEISRFVKPCKLSTIARIVLADLNPAELPSFMTVPNICLALSLPQYAGNFHLNLMERIVEHSHQKIDSVEPNTPIIMETPALTN